MNHEQLPEPGRRPPAYAAPPGVRRAALAVAERMTARDGESAARELPERVRGR